MKNSNAWVPIPSEKLFTYLDIEFKANTFCDVCNTFLDDLKMICGQWVSQVAQRQRICLPMQETQVQSLGQEDPLEKGMQPTPVFLPGDVHEQRSLVGYSPWDGKESDTTEQLTLSLSCTVIKKTNYPFLTDLQ